MIIKEFNTDPFLKNILNRHLAWYGHHNGGNEFPRRTTTMGAPGSGIDFLLFHKSIQSEFFEWNKQHQVVPTEMIESWTSIPEELKSEGLGWSPALKIAEERIITNNPAFNNEDELGIHIENEIHNWLHGAVSNSSLPMEEGEPAIVADPHSVQSTYYYKIHGLIQYWWDQWLLKTKKSNRKVIKWKKIKKSRVATLSADEKVIGQYSSLRRMAEKIGVPFYDGTPEEEALKLLQTAAEIEHALLIEYLYASISIKRDDLKLKILNVSIEEMGHLIAVQNIILFLGGNPYFSRQDISPQPGEDPFPFSLEPFTKTSLEKYLIAEMPSIDTLNQDDQEVIRSIIKRKKKKLTEDLNRVGLIYAKLYWLFQKEDQPEGPWQLPPDGIFEQGRHISTFKGEASYNTYQASPDEPEWRFEYGGNMIGNIISPIITERKNALNVLFEIAAQGEGLQNAENSHFSTFWAVYKDPNTFKKEDLEKNFIKIAANPSLLSAPHTNQELEKGRITHPLAILWAKLFDLRYNVLLTCLTASLLLNREKENENSRRKSLIKWALEEMKLFIKWISKELIELPCKAGGTVEVLAASPPFTIHNEFLSDSIEQLNKVLINYHNESDSLLNEIISFPGVSEASIRKANEIKRLNQLRINNNI